MPGPICVKLKVPTTYWCCVNCPGNPDAWKRHAPYHKAVKRRQKLVAEGLRYGSKDDIRREARAYREAIALEPDEAGAYLNLGSVLSDSGHYVEAAQRYLEARERLPVGSEDWARATARAFSMLTLEACAEVAKPEWWNDEGLKALSARVVRAAPDFLGANRMRAFVLCGQHSAWEAGPRSAAELKEAATHFERAAALCPAPVGKAELAELAGWCRSQARAMCEE